jgi:1,4-dihydroxy-2-naphthoate octaprenyltransferase
MGARATRAYYDSLLALAFAAPVALTVTRWISPAALLPLVTLPLGLRLAREVSRASDGATWNAALAGTARLAASFALLFAAGIAA